MNFYCKNSLTVRLKKQTSLTKKRCDLYFSKIKSMLRSLLLKLKIYYIHICLSTISIASITITFFMLYKNNCLKKRIKNLEEKTSFEENQKFEWIQDQNKLNAKDASVTADFVEIELENAKEDEKRKLHEMMINLIQYVNPNIKNSLSNDRMYIILSNMLMQYSKDRSKRILESSEAKQKRESQKYLFDICEALKTGDINQEYDDQLHEEVLNILHSIHRILEEEKQSDCLTLSNCSTATSRRSSMCLQNSNFASRSLSMSGSLASCYSSFSSEEIILAQRAECAEMREHNLVCASHLNAAFTEEVLSNNEELMRAISQLGEESELRIKSLIQNMEEACLSIEKLKQDAENEKQVFAGLIESKQSKINELTLKLEEANRNIGALKKFNNYARPIIDSLKAAIQPNKSKM